MGRVKSRVRMAIRKPSPSSPRRFSAGTSQSWRWSATVGEARMPILRSFLPTAKPGKPGSTRKAVIPRGPLPGSTVANSVITPACEPLEHQSLVPLRTYRSPFRTAVVRSDAASEPASGSDRE